MKETNEVKIKLDISYKDALSGLKKYSKELDKLIELRKALDKVNKNLDTTGLDIKIPDMSKVVSRINTLQKIMPEFEKIINTFMPKAKKEGNSSPVAVNGTPKYLGKDSEINTFLDKLKELIGNSGASGNTTTGKSDDKTTQISQIDALTDEKQAFLAELKQLNAEEQEQLIESRQNLLMANELINTSANSEQVDADNLYDKTRAQAALEIQNELNEQLLAMKTQHIADEMALDAEQDEQKRLSFEQQLNQLSEHLQTVDMLAGSTKTILNAVGQDATVLGEFSKAMALFQIGIDTSKALSAGIAQSQSVPFPGNLIAIATTTATILSAIGKAKSMLSKEKSPAAPKFNRGGLVSGAGSGTSDSIDAHLSNGESVLTAMATSMFSPILSAFNQIGGGVPISTQNSADQVLGEEMLSRAFSRAIQDMPSPQVSVREINAVNVHSAKNVESYSL